MRLQLTAILLSIILISAKCSRDDDLPFDACKDKVAFKADFTIEEKIGDTSFITNRALAPGYLFFKAKGEYDSVRWFIGDPQNTSTRFNHVLYFEQAEGNVQVTFIGYRKPKTQCFPNEKTIDTLKKTVTIVPRDNKAAIVGRYLGYNTNNPSDTFSVYINADNSVGIWQYFVKNLPKNCPGAFSGSDAPPRFIGLNVSAGNFAFSIDNGSTVCRAVIGFGYLKTYDTLTINYTVTPMSSGPPFIYYENERKEFTFIGIRKH